MASREPFTVRREGGLLLAELDTPGSSVNVFGPPAASQLGRILDGLDGAELLVLRSRKPGSFVNGAGLLYSTAMTSQRQALALSAPVRAIYERLAAAPVPTVAVIEGNCFGCGLELALACQRRIGRDVVETSFRMTELTDYRFVPLFGGTWRLPRTVGARAAAALLLDGERWTAKQAHARGLLDELLPHQGFEEALQRTLSRPMRARRRRPPAGHTRRREVPPPGRELWERTRALIEADVTLPPARARDAEVRAFAKTVVSEPSKRASAFFFVRQMARSAALGDADRRPPTVGLALSAREAAALPELVPTLAQEPARRIRAGTSARNEVQLLVGWRPAHRGRGLQLYFPHGLTSGAVCEVATPAEQLPLARELSRYLEWIGFEPLPTRSSDGQLVANRFLARFLVELAELVARGAAPGAIRRSLWDAGFGLRLAPVRKLREVVASARGPLPRGLAGSLSQLVRAGHGGRPWPGALDALCAGLLCEAAACLDEGLLLHLSQADVLARQLLDFPLEEGSLLLRADRVGLKATFEAAERAGWRGELPGSLRARVEAGKGMYR